MRWIVLIFGVFGYYTLAAQQYASKEYYLVDSLNFSELSKSDSLLIDSCLKVYYSSDSLYHQIYALEEICEEMMHKDWVKYQFKQQEIILQCIADPKYYTFKKELSDLLAGTYNNIGYSFMQNGNLDRSIEYYTKALEVQQGINDSVGIAVSFNNLGYSYNAKGLVSLAMENYSKSLELYRGLSDSLAMADLLNNIGMIQRFQSNFDEALSFYNESLIIREKKKDLKGMALAYNNIGSVYEEKKEEELAISYYYKSLKIKKQLNNKLGIAITLSNIGEFYSVQNQLDSALKYLQESLKISEQISDKYGISTSSNNLGQVKLKQGKLQEAYRLFKISLEQGMELGVPNIISAAAENLSIVAKNKGNYNEALSAYELHIQMRDSIKNEETQKAAIRQQTKYEFEKAQLVAEQKRKETLRVQEERTQRRNNLQYSVIFIAILGVFGMVLALGKISVSPKVAEGLIFFAFLILFEFLLVLSDPYVEGFTNGEPMYKLTVNALLAALIFPLHAYFESRLKLKLVKKE